MSKSASRGDTNPAPPTGAPTAADTVSKYAGQPGALTALRVDYTTKDRAFGNHSTTSALGKVRDEVKHLSSGPRLGDKPLWNCSSSTVATTSLGGALCGSGPVGSVHYAPPGSCMLSAVPGLPQRPLMSQNSAYQAIKLDYNFRADALPPVKELLYVPRHNKLEVDKTEFLLSEQGKKATTVITNKCLTTASALSRCEGQNNFNGKKDGEVHPLEDTFGAHNVRRHMTIRRPYRPSAGSADRSGQGDGFGDTRSDADGSFSGTRHSGRHAGNARHGDHSALAEPSSLRQRTDVDVSRHAASAVAATQREAGWNTSAALPRERADIHKISQRREVDYREINKRKEGKTVLCGLGLASTTADSNAMSAMNESTADPEATIAIDVAAELECQRRAQSEAKRRRQGVYKTPIEAQKAISEAARAAKLATREAHRQNEERRNIDALTLRGGSAGPSRGGSSKGKSSVLSSGHVYKMSNKEEWWSALPAQLEGFREQLSGSHVKSTDALNLPEGGDPNKEGVKTTETAKMAHYVDDTDSDAD